MNQVSALIALFSIYWNNKLEIKLPASQISFVTYPASLRVSASSGNKSFLSFCTNPNLVEQFLCFAEKGSQYVMWQNAQTVSFFSLSESKESSLETEEDSDQLHFQFFFNVLRRGEHNCYLFST